MKRIRKLLTPKSKSLSAPASSAPPPTALPHERPAPSFTTLTRPVSPLLPPVALAEELRSSPDQTARTNLKEVFEAVRAASDLCPPFKTALSAVISTMDSIDLAAGSSRIFVRSMGAEKDISPAMRNKLDAVTAFVIAALFIAASPNLVSRKLKLLEEAMIGSKAERGRARRAPKALGDVDKVAIAFKRLGNVIHRFQPTPNHYMNIYGSNMGLHTSNHYMNIYGGVGGAGGASERGTGGNGGLGQGPTLNINATHCSVNNLSTDVSEKLGYVSAADIDAQSPEGCLQGTRVDLLADLRAWSLEPNSPRIFWLDGMAGTGKSAVTRSFCRILRKNKRLGGSFFCLRGDASRGNPKRILPTLAIQLASQHVAYKSALLAALDAGISSDANLEIQVEELLKKPLRSVDNDAPPTLVLVIDALDELDDENETKDLLQRLVAVVPWLPVKLF
ncbi:hypothetical protein B0H14DRAFT_3908718, partial [Mycena olivaceomarginata]